MSSLILPPGYANRSGLTHSRPQANPELEARIRPWLKDMDELLDVHWTEGIVWNKRHKAFEGRYALVCKWPQGDKRLGMIQSGELGDYPYDILGWFTEDMQDGGTAAIPLDMFENRVLELLASADNAATPWKARLAQVAAKNVERKRKLKQSFIENEVHDLASHHRNAGLKIAQVSVAKEIK